MADLETIQFAAFPTVPMTTDAGALWKEAVPAQSFANFSTISPGHTSASAIVAGIMMEIQSQPVRVDLFLTGSVPSYPPPKTLPTLPSFTDAVAIGRPAFTRLLELFEIARLAVVVQAHEEASDEDDAVRRFIDVVPIDLKPNSRDPQFQTNVRKGSTSQGGLELNRLCRWATASMINLGFRPASPFSGPIPLPIKQTYTLQSYIDVNTAPGSSINQDLKSLLCEELVTEAKLILDGGYNAL